MEIQYVDGPSKKWMLLENLWKLFGENNLLMYKTQTFC